MKPLHLKTQSLERMFLKVQKYCFRGRDGRGSFCKSFSSKKFQKEEYLAEFGNENQIAMACVAHDIVARIGTIVMGSNSPEKLMEDLHRSDVLEGACGVSSFGRSDSGEQFVRFPISLKTITESMIVEINN